MNEDETHPSLINNQQFKHALAKMGFQVPSFDYSAATVNKKLIPVVLETHRYSKGTYGVRRIADEVKDHGSQRVRYRARTLMNMALLSIKRIIKILKMPNNMLSEKTWEL